MEEGVRLRREGRDQEAADRFRSAHEQGGAAAALAQLAVAEQALGHWIDAAEHLDAALVDATNEWIVRHRRTLDASLAIIHGHLGMIEIDSDAVGARVCVDGRDV